MRTPTQALQRVRIAVFALLLVTPLLGYVSGVGRPTGQRENRRLSRLPPWPTSAVQLSDFTEGLGAYWDDHFGFRDGFTWAYSNALYYGLGTVPFGKVRVTQSGWVFDNIDDASDCEQRLPPADELDALARRMVELGTQLHRRGIAYIVVLVPNRSQVHRPEVITQACPIEQTAGHRVGQAIRRLGGRFPVVDPFPELVARRTQDDLYYRTDPHWTELGAFEGYQKLMTEVRTLYSQIEPLTPEDFVRETRSVAGGSLSRTANLDLREPPAVFLRPRRAPLARRITPPCAIDADNPWGYERQVLRYERSDGGLPTLLVFRDSYFEPFKRWLPEHFARTTFIWSRPHLPTVERDAPDLVIEQHSF